MSEAVVDGAKIGAAAKAAEGITTAVLNATKVNLPSFLKEGIGRELLPILVCYAIAFLTTLLPANVLAKGPAVRRYCIMAAKGTTAKVIANVQISEAISMLQAQIIGQAVTNDLI
jgi:hypothetical protein